MYGWKATINIFGSHEERIQGTCMYKTRLYGMSNSYTSNHYTCISYHNTCNANRFPSSKAIPPTLHNSQSFNYWILLILLQYLLLAFWHLRSSKSNFVWGAQSFVMIHCFPPPITDPIWNPVYVSMCLLYVIRDISPYEIIIYGYLSQLVDIFTCYCSIFLHCGLQLNREWEPVMNWVWQQEDSDYWKMMDTCMGQE